MKLLHELLICFLLENKAFDPIKLGTLPRARVLSLPITDRLVSNEDRQFLLHQINLLDL